MRPAEINFLPSFASWAFIYPLPSSPGNFDFSGPTSEQLLNAPSISQAIRVWGEIECDFYSRQPNAPSHQGESIPKLCERARRGASAGEAISSSRRRRCRDRAQRHIARVLARSPLRIHPLQVGDAHSACAPLREVEQRKKKGQNEQHVTSPQTFVLVANNRVRGPAREGN